MRPTSVEAARAAMLARADPLDCEEIALAEAQGRVLGSDVVARRGQPPFSASAMDGWAVRASDLPGALTIVGESAAGRGFAGTVGPGEAVRIFTGAAVPAGADRVVIQERAVRDGDLVVIKDMDGPDHIRPTGGDFGAGETLLTAGSRLDPWRLALAAAAGSAKVGVRRRPRVVILSTGEEIVEPGRAPSEFQIFNSGGAALAGLTRLWGGEPWVLSSVGDMAGAVAQALSGAGGDLIVTLGGASVGDHDLVRADLGALGLTLDVESIAVRPGKPTFFGVLGDGRRVLGLPGNPASALVCAELFLRPLLMALQGARPERGLRSARTTAALAANGGREHWMRAELGGAADGALSATPFADQDSSLVKVFARADALIRRASGASPAAIGDPVEVLVLERML